jgi:NitT/TauT family transport system substrate-binding protein
MNASNLENLDAVEQNVPTLAVAAMFQKDPQSIIAHPGQGYETFTDLKKAPIFISTGVLATYFQWMKAEFGFTDSQVKPYLSNLQPFLRRQEERHAGLSHLGTLRGREAGRLHAEDLPARRPGLHQLLDAH